MKIVMINGSPRKNGATAQMLGHIQHYLEAKEDVEVSYFHLESMNIATCKGCSLCFKTGSCFIQDDAEKLSQHLALADGVIIGSPTYASNVSGQLKTFIDRGHLVMEQLLYDSYALGIITYENYGGSSAAHLLKNVLSYSGAFISGLVTFKLPFSNSHPLSPSATRLLNHKAERLYQDIQTKHNYLIQRWIHSLIFHIGIKPFVLKKGDAYAGVKHHWPQS